MLARVAVPVGGVAHAGEDLVDRHHGGDLRPRQHGGEIAGEERNFGVGLGAGGIVRGDCGCVGRRQHLLRIERRDVGGELGHRERQIAGDPHERAHAHDLAVVGAAHRGRDTE